MVRKVMAEETVVCGLAGEVNTRGFQPLSYSVESLPKHGGYKTVFPGVSQEPLRAFPSYRADSKDVRAVGVSAARFYRAVGEHKEDITRPSAEVVPEPPAVPGVFQIYGFPHGA